MVVPSRKLTVPVGVAEPPVSFTLKVTGEPTVAVVGTVSAIVGVTRLIVSVCTVEVAGPNVLSPLYVMLRLCVPTLRLEMV